MITGSALGSLAGGRVNADAIGFASVIPQKGNTRGRPSLVRQHEWPSQHTPFRLAIGEGSASIAAALLPQSNVVCLLSQFRQISRRDRRIKLSVDQEAGPHSRVQDIA